MPMAWADRDTGTVVTRIFDDYRNTVGKTYGICQLVNLAEATALFEKVAGKKNYVPIDRNQFIQQMGGGVAAYHILGNLEFFAGMSLQLTSKQTALFLLT